MKGLVHIYSGNGKGKTTASVGLAVRAAGSGKKVVFSQFFKNGSSGEIGILSSIPGIRVMICAEKFPLFRRMTPQQREYAAQAYRALLAEVLNTASSDTDLLVLDEVISACNHAIVDEQTLLSFLANKPDTLEVVLTGRDPSQRLCELADYHTEMRKQCHPFDAGIPARKGIEY